MIVPDRSIILADQLLSNGDLYDLSSEEHSILSGFLYALLEVTDSEATFAINEKYRDGILNIYVVDKAWGAASGWKHGNASYAAASDILFIDAAYFREGEEFVFSNTGDDLTRSVIAAVRFYSFFIIAHEIGHREQSRSRRAFLISRTKSSQQLERDADQRAMAALMQLYRNRGLVESGVIPPPVSSLTSFASERVTPLQHLSDHTSYTLGFLSDDFFDGPFPILSQSATHPEYFLRLSAILDDLAIEAEANEDEDALRILNLGRSTSLATLSIISLKPTEIEFDYPFQYAYLTEQELVVVGNDGVPFYSIKLSSLRRQWQVHRSLPEPQTEATVRYAWPIDERRAFTLRRDGVLAIVERNTGKTLGEASLRGRIGDNSCAKQFIRSAKATGVAYLSYCKNGERFVSVLNSDMRIVEHDLSTLAQRVKESLSDANGDKHSVVGFVLSGGGDPMLYTADRESIYAAGLSPSLEVVGSRQLALKASTWPEPLRFRGARIDRNIVFADAARRSRYIKSTSLFRHVSLHDAEDGNSEPLAFVDLTPTIESDRLRAVAAFRAAHPIGENRIIINLEEYGAYMVELGKPEIYPVSSQSFSELEQVVANSKGDWILFRKYGSRILLFRKES